MSRDVARGFSRASPRESRRSARLQPSVASKSDLGEERIVVRPEAFRESAYVDLSPARPGEDEIHHRADHSSRPGRLMSWQSRIGKSAAQMSNRRFPVTQPRVEIASHKDRCSARKAERLDERIRLTPPRRHRTAARDRERRVEMSVRERQRPLRAAARPSADRGPRSRLAAGARTAARSR